MKTLASDKKTADAFAESWNHLPAGSVYTKEQFIDWMLPVAEKDVSGKTVLELGCGNASLMVHMVAWDPGLLVGVDLGDSVSSALTNLSKTAFKNWKIEKADLTEYQSSGFDLVYCIGVLHHLKNPKKGLDAVINNTKPGGRFHSWVYAREGNGLVVYLVDPLRKLVSRLPWWATKYFFALPLAVPFYFYAKILSALKNNSWVKRLPLFQYCLWIAKREFGFFRHVAFDQLVTPQTTYISRTQIENWLDEYDRIDKNSIYIIFRNGNSWKFGGKIK